MTSCSHQKIFVASLSSIDNPAEKLKKIEGGKIVFFAKFSGCCSVSMQCKDLFIKIILRIIHASEILSFSPLRQNKHYLLAEPSLHEIMEQK